MDLSITARLAFIGLWNFSDDRGVHPASAKTMKAEIFPSDDLSVQEVGALVAEMIQHDLVAEFEADGKRYWFVTGWVRHQKIDRPTYRHPAPPGNGTSPRHLDEPSSNSPRHLDEPSPPESRGEESIGVECNSNTDVLLVASTGDDSLCNGQDTGRHPACPHQEIIALYHQALPTSHRIRDWTPARAALLRARWNEDPKRQDADWWKRFFAYVAQSDFLAGRISSPGRKPFTASLEWLVKAENFAKVREGRYHSEGGA